jgi:hypothetical protein
MKKQILKINVMILLFGGSIIAKAQTESIITPMTTSCNLTESQLTMVSKANDTNYFKEHFFVNVQNLYNSQEDGKLTLNLPNVWHEPISLTHTNVEYTDENNYVYSGRYKVDVEDEDALWYARLLLISENGKKFGQLKLNGEIYAIYDLNGSCQMIVNVKDKELDGGGCGSITKMDETPNTYDHIDHFDHNEPNSCGSCIADVFFFFTQAADDADPDINQTARTSIEIVNVSIANSKVFGAGSQLRLRISGSEILNGFTETTGINPGASINTDLTNFAQNISIVQTRRNATESDVMVLLTDDVYAGAAGRILGVVQDVDYPRFDNGFHISTFNSAATNHTLAHEIGHLIGLQHQIEEQPLTQTITDDYAHAFQRIKTNNIGGVKKGMWTNVCTRAGAIKEKNTLRLDNYSSPNVTTKECFTGTTTIGNQNIANNAMQTGWHGCELANLYPNNVSVASWLEGPSIVCPGQPAIFELKRNCTGLISNVKWEYSYTGFQWNTFNGGSTYNLSVAQYVPGEMLFIRATFSLNGSVHHTSISSEIDIFASPCVVLYKKEPVNSTNEIADKVVVFPNPSNGITTIQITSDNYSVYNSQSIGVFDLFGRKVGSFKINMPNPGITETQIDLTSYRKGMYIAIINGNRYVLEKI